MIDQRLAQRICGTFDPKAKYAAGDVVAMDGGSFIARRADPVPCPGGGWQLIARQGQRGVAGPPGKDGARITGWILDRANYRITPRLADGSLAPPLELGALFKDDTDAA